MFKPVSTKLKVTLVEEEILRFWKSRQILDWPVLTQADQPGGKSYFCYEDPVSLSAKTDAAELFDQVRKDVLLRYKAMQGFSVIRRGVGHGHGIPIELIIEQQLGLSRKSQIEGFGVAAFNELCRSLVFEHLAEKERLAERLAAQSGARMELTCENNSIEQIWRLTKKLWERGLIYENYQVSPYCPRCGTCVSEQEAIVSTLPIERPSVYVRLPLVEDPGTSLLVWTDQPWTLPANAAVAVQPDVDYVIVEHDFPEGGTEKLIVAQPLLAQVFGVDLPNIRIFEAFKGSKLQGLRYHPLFTFLAVDKPAFYVILENVSDMQTGTGLTPLAPAFDAADLSAAVTHDLPILLTVADDGTFVPSVRPWRGKSIHAAEPFIVDDLQRRGLIYAVETCQSPASFCPDCSAPLLPLARSAWFLRLSAYSDQLIDQSQNIHWLAESGERELYSHWIREVGDWVLGSERYWGSPLPVWECSNCHNQICAADRAELSQLTGRSLEQLDLHRPVVDEIKFACSKCGGVMERVFALLDARFEASVLPLANRPEPDRAIDEMEAADYIGGPAAQTRSWFYRQQAVNAALGGQGFVRNVVFLSPNLPIPSDASLRVGTPWGSDPWTVLNEYGADMLRWCALKGESSGEVASLPQALEKISQEFIFILWDAYSSLVTAANLHGWSPETAEGHSSNNPLDRWILSELHRLLPEISAALDQYALHQAAAVLEYFVVDLLGNWYLPHALKRLGTNAEEGGPQTVFSTLYQVLVTLSRVLAPMLPFLAEEIYQNLVVFVSEKDRTTTSVHLTGWPEPDYGMIDLRLNADMRLLVGLTALSKKMRSQAGIKSTQPLPEFAFWIESEISARAAAHFEDLLLDALQVKKIGKITAEAANQLAQARLVQGLVSGREEGYIAVLHTTITPELRKEGLVGEFVGRIEELRRKFEFTQFEQIDVRLTTTLELAQILHPYRNVIMNKIRASTLEIMTTLDRATSGEIMDFDGQKAVFEVSKSTFSHTGGRFLEF